jgi:hypothetical protein
LGKLLYRSRSQRKNNFTKGGDCTIQKQQDSDRTIQKQQDRDRREKITSQKVAIALINNKTRIPQVDSGYEIIHLYYMD